jgi:hypothetical protein
MSENAEFGKKTKGILGVKVVFSVHEPSNAKCIILAHAKRGIWPSCTVHAFNGKN